MLVIPVGDVPSQQLSVLLDGQQCQVTVRTLDTGLFLDLAVQSTPIVSGRACLDRTPIAVDAYLGFTGQLVWADTQGTSDPAFPGLGTRYQLVYLEASDLP